MRNLIKLKSLLILCFVICFFTSCLEKRNEFWKTRIGVVEEVYLRGGRSSTIVARCNDGSYWYTKKLDKFKKGDKIYYFSNTHYGVDKLKLIKTERR